MKNVFLTAVAVLMSVCVYAQKPVVVVDYFSYPSSVKDGYASALRSSVIAGINSVNRVNLVDAESEAALELEALRRNREMAMEDQTARIGAMKTIGADYIITGVISNISADYNRPDDGKPYYNGNVLYALTVMNVSDGTVVGTKNFVYSKLTGNTGSTAEEAIISTFSRVKQSMDNFVNEYFKLKGVVVEMNEASKKGDQAKSCYISLGSDHGIVKGQLLDVFEVKAIAGREALSEIGSLRVSEVVAGDLALAVVTKGGKEIMAAFKKGSELRVETKKDNALTNILQGTVDTFK